MKMKIEIKFIGEIELWYDFWAAKNEMKSIDIFNTAFEEHRFCE